MARLLPEGLLRALVVVIPGLRGLVQVLFDVALCKVANKQALWLDCDRRSGSSWLRRRVTSQSIVRLAGRLESGDRGHGVAVASPTCWSWSWSSSSSTSWTRRRTLARTLEPAAFSELPGLHDDGRELGFETPRHRAIEATASDAAFLLWRWRGRRFAVLPIGSGVCASCSRSNASTRDRTRACTLFTPLLQTVVPREELGIASGFSSPLGEVACCSPNAFLLELSLNFSWTFPSFSSSFLQSHSRHLHHVDRLVLHGESTTGHCLVE